MIEYRRASNTDIEKLWQDAINNAKTKEDKIKFEGWKDQFITDNNNNSRAIFVAVENDVPFGELSLIIDPEVVKQYSNKDLLCNKDTSTAYLAKAKIDEKYENKGHFSKLLKVAELYAKNIGIKHLTLAVYEQETRNVNIYTHLGYTQLIDTKINDNLTCLYLRKTL